MDRREFIAALTGSTALAVANAEAAEILATPQFGIRTHYVCEMDLIADGREHTLIAGGEHHVWSAYDGGTLHTWLPFAAAQRLPSGEILVAVPPSPEGAIDKAYRTGAGKLTGAPMQFLPFLDVQYPASAVPMVYIFDQGTEPKRVEAYLMRAALLGGTRVSARGCRIRQSRTDPRTSIADIVPLFKPFEELVRVLPEGPNFTANSESYRAWARRWARGNAPATMDSIFPSLGTYGAALRPISQPFSFGGKRSNFQALNKALRDGERPAVWLRASTKADGTWRFTDGGEPRVAVFEALAKRRIFKEGIDELEIGGLAFPSARSSDGAAQLVFCGDISFGDPLLGRNQGQTALTAPAMHSTLSPTTAGKIL